MRKGKFGICLWFYAALAFVLAFLQQNLLCVLLLGFVILAERDEWASRQVMQATFLCLLGSLISGVLGIFNVLKSIPFAGTLFSGVFSFISGIVSLLILIFCIIALTRVVKEKDANIPLLNTLTDRIFGVVKQKVYTVPPQQPYGAQPPYSAPQQPAYPNYPPQQPVSSAPQAAPSAPPAQPVPPAEQTPQQ